MTKIAGVQMDIQLAAPETNRERISERFRAARRAGAELVIFPECAVTGYCLNSREEGLALAETIPGPTTTQFAKLCAESGGELIVGMLETDGEKLFNACCHVSATGVVAVYRKVHLPYLGIDRFVDFGDRPFEVYESAGLRLGMNICYDSGFPESSRALMLAGVDLVALPTNWPGGAEILAAHAIATRAMENGIYYAAINRVGDEAGFRFIGRSRICDPRGETLALAEATGEEILFAEIDPDLARRKTIVRVPGEHLIDRVRDRRPEFYGLLTAPQDEPRPGRDLPASEFE